MGSGWREDREGKAALALVVPCALQATNLSGTSMAGITLRPGEPVGNVTETPDARHPSRPHAGGSHSAVNHMV